MENLDFFSGEQYRTVKRQSISSKIDEVDISVIIPLLNEEKNVEKLSNSLINALNKTGKKFEIVYIDDGSIDKTFHILKTLHDKHNFIKIIRFTGNFGQQRALSAGIKYAKGKVIITMDGDLQYNPEEIPKFLKKIDEGHDAVVGYRKIREGGLFTRRLPSRIANIILSFLTGIRIRDFGCPFRAFKKELKENIESYGEAGMSSSVSFVFWRTSNIAGVEIDNPKRQSGKTRYSFSSLSLLLLDFIIIFSVKPFQIFILISMGLSAIILGVIVIISTVFRLFSSTTILYIILSSIFFFTGIGLITMGVINERISRITSRLQQKPYYIIQEIVE